MLYLHHNNILRLIGFILKDQFSTMGPTVFIRIYKDAWSHGPAISFKGGDDDPIQTQIYYLLRY